MQKTKLMVAVLGALCAMPVFAADAPAAPAAPVAAAAPAVTGSFGFVSDYVFNGISQSFRSPALQGGFDYNHASGLYVGTWASNISGNQYTNANMEWDIYGGYKGKVSDDLSYDVGLMTVTYPAGKTADPTTAVYKRWDTAEVVAGATWKSLNVKLTYTLTDWYGINNGGYAPQLWNANGTLGAPTADNPTKTDLGSTGSTYVELNYTYEVSDSLKVIAHIGNQKVANFSKLDYTDYKLAVSKSYEGFDFGLAFTTTNATDNNLYHVKANGDDKVLSGNIIAASVSHAF